MLSGAMAKTPSEVVNAPAVGIALADEHADDHPDKLDAALLRIAAICALACIMAVLDSTIVAVAQRTFSTVQPCFVSNASAS